MLSHSKWTLGLMIEVLCIGLNMLSHCKWTLRLMIEVCVALRRQCSVVLV